MISHHRSFVDGRKVRAQRTHMHTYTCNYHLNLEFMGLSRIYSFVPMTFPKLCTTLFFPPMLGYSLALI